MEGSLRDWRPGRADAELIVDGYKKAGAMQNRNNTHISMSAVELPKS